MTRYSTIGIQLGEYTSPSTTVYYGQIENVDGFETVAADLDISETTDEYDEHMSGSKSVSPISFTLHYDSTLHATLRDSIGTDKVFAVKLPDDKVVHQGGYLQSFKIVGGDNKGKLTAACTIQPSGAPTWVA